MYVLKLVFILALCFFAALHVSSDIRARWFSWVYAHVWFAYSMMGLGPLPSNSIE